MKMVVAYVEPAAVDPIRADLLGLALRFLSVSEASCRDPEHAASLHYRGATLTPQLRRRVKLERVVGGEEVASVVDSVVRHTRGNALADDTVFVIAMEQAYRIGAATSGDDARLRSASAAGISVGVSEEPSLAAAR